MDYADETYPIYSSWSKMNFIAAFLLLGGGLLGLPFALPALICSLVYKKGASKTQSTIILVLNILATIFTVLGTIAFLLLMNLLAAGVFHNTHFPTYENPTYYDHIKILKYLHGKKA